MSYLPVAFFSRVLKPGEGLEVELEEASAILTSVTFGEAVKGDKRSTLSLTYLDRMADPEEQIAAMAEDEEDKEGDDDDDSDVSFNTHAVMRKAVIASLLPGKIENAAINVTLNSGEVYELSVSGNNEVHVTGQYVLFPTDQENEDDSDSDDEDSELDSDEFGEYDPETGLLGGEITGLTDGEDGSDIEEDPSRFEELKETPKKTKALPQAEKVKKAETEADTSMDVADVSLASADTSKLSKNQKKKLKKLEKQQKPDDGEAKAAEVALKATSTPAAADVKKGAAAEKAVEESSDAKKPSKKQTLPSGLVIEDAKVGKGPSAKRGQNLAMRYIGKLPNGKIFDQNTKGQPFKFKLGVGEVIKGWDEGLKGMAAGGERKLTIPAAMAYGKKGVDGIPGGATLHFDVKLLSIK